jgi:hypothetical protein
MEKGNYRLMNPNQSDKTSPSGYDYPSDTLKAPPKFLLYGCLFIFIMAIVGSVGGVIAFREVLRPAQQQRVINMLPFMRSFLPAAPAHDATVPTSLAPTPSTEDIDNLLFGDLGLSGTNHDDEETETPAPTEEVTEAPTQAPSATPTQTPTIEPTEVSQVATLEPTATPTLEATATPNFTATPTEDISGMFATAQASLPPVQPQNWPMSAMNTGMTWYSQGWNNCGPATITMAMSYYGWTRDHTYARERIRPNYEDRNASPHELVRFVNNETDNMKALWRYGGDLAMIRRLVSAGFPVVIERSHMFSAHDWLGHFQAIIGYDDTKSEFTIMDSFLGQSTGGNAIVETYDEVNAGWREFNYTFIVVYQPADEALVMRLMGDERATLETSAEHAFTLAQTQARSNRNDAFAFFNMGTSLTAMGMYEEASRAYDQATALQQLPWRLFWYQFGIFEAYYEVGRYDDVMQLANNNINSSAGGRYVEETYYWKGRVLAAQGDIAGARQEFNRALQYNQYYIEAREALNELN